ncbi:MAG TPA: hypothetical protein VK541_02925 [Pedobacter sp.]|uniref:hypothetical protein n=1 Tax=Pedobacter sp. TaxID=1411316 RepID=UPI002BC2B1C1|nr:hypothetical protein [Pedobacter sp.]HMI01403.1 hypothetical protein [Pedobacter sp.]
MKIKTKEEIKFNFRSPLHGKRDYYFHADEDFREDREWGKTKSTTIKASTSVVRACMEA